MTLRRFFNHVAYYLAIVHSWYTAWMSRSRPLHTARWTFFHELTLLLTDKFDNTQILLGKKPFCHGMFHRLFAVKPTKTQRELGHVLLVGKHRSGKGLAIETNLLSWPHSVIVNDIKKELWHRTAGWREKGLGGKSYLFDPAGFGARFDPLEGKRTDSELRSAATTLLYRPAERENAIFIERAITMLVAIFHAGVLEGERLLPFTYRVLNEGLYAVATILEIISVKHNAYPNLATKFLDTTYDKADFDDKFLRDCFSTLTTRLNQILTKESVRCFTGSDFTAKELITCETPVSVYLYWSEEDLPYLAPLIRLVWDSLINGMIGYYNSVQGKGCERVLCVLDEIFRTGLPKLPEYTTTVSGRNISFLIASQSIAQMDSAFRNKDTADVFRGQMDATIFYRPAAVDNATPEYIERACGYTSGFAHSTTDHKTGSSTGENEQRVPLMPAHETKHMDATEIIGLASGLHPFREKRLNRYDFPELKERGTMPPPTCSPLPDIDRTSSRKTHFTLPDRTQGDPLPHFTDYHRTGYEERGNAIWHRDRKLPNGYIDPDKRY